MRRRKVLPGIITLAANDKKPANDSRSAKGVELLVSIALTSSRARWSLAGGRRASIAMESSSMPKNSAVVPVELFLILTASPRSLQRSSNSWP